MNGVTQRNSRASNVTILSTDKDLQYTSKGHLENNS